MGEEIAAIGITNQRETTVVRDKNRKPIHNAIVAGRRTAAICDSIKEKGFEELIRERPTC